jgi:hypothetical protein
MTTDLFGVETKATPRETERTMLDRLNLRYGKTYKNGSYIGRQYIRAEHVPDRVSTVYGRQRIADYIAIDLFESKDRTPQELEARENYGRDNDRALVAQPRSLLGFEVKVSRADWLTELRDPSKAEAWARYCHYWTLVVSDVDIVRDDLPTGWGLLVPHGKSLRLAVKPTRRDPDPMPVGVIATLMRAVMQTEVRIAGGTS